ncbi:hypothetical protein K6H10_004381 [Candida tropicalis]
MFLSSSPRLFPSTRFDMLDPIDHTSTSTTTGNNNNNNNSNNNTNTIDSNTINNNTNQNYSTISQDFQQQQQQQQQQAMPEQLQGTSFAIPQVEDDLMFNSVSSSTQQHQASSSIYQYQQPFMSTSNYLLDEPSFNNEDNQGLDLESSTTTSTSTSNFYGQSINVNLGAIPSNSNTSNAGQSSYYGAFNPPQPLYQQNSHYNIGTANNSSTSSSLHSFHTQQQQEYAFSTPPAQQPQLPSSISGDIYASSSSMTSFFDPSHHHQHQQQPPQSQTINFDLNQNYPHQPPSSATSTTFDLNYTSSSPLPQFQQQQYSSSLPKASTSTSYKAKSRATSSRHSPSIKKEPDHESSIGGNDKKLYSSFSKDRYRVIRGVSAGGCSTRPPKESIESDSIYLPVELNLIGASIEDVCYPKWSVSEKQDRRRIIRIERIQNGPKITANFSIIGNANENPVTLPPSSSNIDVVEVSCLECDVRINDDYESQSSDDEVSSNNNNTTTTTTGGTTTTTGGKSPSYIKNEVDGEYYQYYITSVEVVEIVELLIGNQFRDAAERRRERGRVRSNLVPFWSKKPISSRMSENSMNSSSNNTLNIPSGNTLPTNHDYRMELAKRIMGYEIRKPRGFDKEVRILRWDKLIPALKRALQSYYTEIPQHDSHLQF